MSAGSQLIQYPQASALEERLKHLAVEMGDVTPKPFRVDIVRVHGANRPSIPS
jgi:hypothetical protein